MQMNSAAQANLPAAAGNGEQTKQLVAEGKTLPVRCVASQPDLRRATATVVADGAGVVGTAELRSRSSAAPECSLAGPARAATAVPTIRQSKLVLVPARQEKPSATTANVKRTSTYGAAPTLACDGTNYRRSCSKPAVVRHLQAAERAGAACHQCAPLARSRPSSSRSRRCLLSPLLLLLLLLQNLLELHRLYLPLNPLQASAHSGSPQLRLRHWCLLLHRTSAAPPSPPCKTRQQSCCSFTMRCGSVAPGRQRPRTVGQEVMPPPRSVAVLKSQNLGKYLQ